MSNDDHRVRLSRRNVLAGLGGIGLASAGAGLGTSALFSDEESFENNTITAGTLDLKIDWQQMYRGPTEEMEFVNAHPDHDNDGEQSIVIDGETYRYSDDGSNIVEHLDCENLGQNYAENFGENQDSLVSLDDVKPGDEGEITFSLHLCSNPGYVWLTADNFAESGGVTTEPEGEELGAEETDDGELAENTFVEIWYDEDCDNGLDESGDGESDEVDVMIVLDRSGSMNDDTGDDASSDKWQGAKDGAKDLIEALGPGAQVGLVTYADNAVVDEPIGASESALDSTINGLSTGGSTNMADAITTAQAEFGNSGRSSARDVMVMLTNGVPSSDDPRDEATAAKDAGTTIYGIAYGSDANENVIEDISSPPKVDDDAITADDEYAFLASTTDIEGVFDDIGQQISGGEQVILGEGDGEHESPVTLAEAMDIMANNGGMIPLDGDGDMEYGDGPTAESRDCFEPYTGHCIGMRWWVPAEVGNEIQDDSAEFDLGFYAEQCRNNDGSGPEEASP